MAVALGRIDAEALQDVDAQLLLLREDRMRLEGCDQLVLADLAALDAHIDKPGLVVDARADVVEFAILGAEDFGDLLAAMLDAMAQADRIDLAVLDRRPGVHRHRVGVVQEFRAWLGDFADILAEVEDDRDVALAVENAAGADRIADALVDAVFQRDADIVGIGFQAADAHAADDVARALDRLAAVGRGGHLGRAACSP